MTKEEIINFIYYLQDKIDPVFKKEVDKSIQNVIEKLKKEK